MHNSSQSQITVWFKDRILVSECDIGSDDAITNCTLEEADATLIRYARDNVSEVSQIIMQAIDNVVHVLLISFTSKIPNYTDSTTYTDMYLKEVRFFII